MVDAKWVDPFTPMERWMFQLPNMYLKKECHCGSGKPVVYWSPDDGTCCEDCRFSLAMYIPYAVIWNILEKFSPQISYNEALRILDMVKDPRDNETEEKDS